MKKCIYRSGGLFQQAGLCLLGNFGGKGGCASDELLEISPGRSDIAVRVVFGGCLSPYCLLAANSENLGFSCPRKPFFLSNIHFFLLAFLFPRPDCSKAEPISSSSMSKGRADGEWSDNLFP